MTITITGTSFKRDILDRKPPLEINFSHFNFSAGEQQIRLLDIDALSELSHIRVHANIDGSGEEWVRLLLILQALREVKDGPPKPLPSWNLNLEIPYLPYSRQDRTCARGEAFSLSVFANSFRPYLSKTDSLITWDAHSPVAKAIFSEFTNFVNISVYELMGEFMGMEVMWSPDTIIIAPDKGAVSRAEEAAEFITEEAAEFIGSSTVKYATKVRNPENGQILRTEVQEGDYKGKNLLIVDDICDGGRTFIELAKVLRKYEPSRVDLYVTHGIFSKGFDVFEGLIDHFYVANLLPNRSFYAETPDNLTFLQKSI